MTEEITNNEVAADNNEELNNNGGMTEEVKTPEVEGENVEVAGE